MARKKKPEEHENHERWLVSYADFITLLFAFFVVMYSVSSVNEGKYRVLSRSMIAAFSPTTRSLTPIQIGELTRSPATIVPSVLESPRPVTIVPFIISVNTPEFVVDSEFENNAEERLLTAATQEFEYGEEERVMLAAAQQIENIAEDIQEVFGALINENDVQVRTSPLWLEVEFNSSILFGSGSANLSQSALVELGSLATMLTRYSNQVTVEGFTDDQPIRNSIYPSNWELSSSRAAAVVRLFADVGVDPARMSSVGYGEHRPIQGNEDNEGRAANRRVIVVIMANIPKESLDVVSPMNNLNYFRQRLADPQR